MGHNCHFSNCWPPTSDDHNFFFRTLFHVFLDSMERPLSHDYSHGPVEDSSDHKFSKHPCFGPSVQVAWLCRCEWSGFDMTIEWHVVGYCIG